MHDFPDADYIRARARQERDMAIASENNRAALVHFKMADEYERRARLISRLAGERGRA